MLRGVFAMVLCAVMALSVDAAKPKRDISNVKKERQTTQKEIKETSRQLSKKAKEAERELSKLSGLRNEISKSTKAIGVAQADIDSINTRIGAMSDTLMRLTSRRDSLSRAYMMALRSVQGEQGSMGIMAYLFSSRSFSDAFRRVRYMREFAKWSARRRQEIDTASTRVEEHKGLMRELHRQRAASLSSLTQEKRNLEGQKQQSDALVAKLKKEQSSLKAALKAKEKRMRALDAELDRLIATEQARAEKARKEAEAREKAKAEAAAKKKPGSGKSQGKTPSKTQSSKSSTSGVSGVAEADRKLNGSFEGNKGNLLFPVSGKYRIVRGFGRQKHPELEHVETDNSGIDVEALSGSYARAIFAGKVSAIFKQPGFNTIVMVRHGSYLSIYANLAGLNVKVGDAVKAGQRIGSIYADPDDGNRAILHFELRKERQKLNPTLWVK